MSLWTLSIPGALPFFSAWRNMRIRVSGSTSATKSLSLSVLVVLLLSGSSGVKRYEWAPKNLLMLSK